MNGTGRTRENGKTSMIHGSVVDSINFSFGGAGTKRGVIATFVHVFYACERGYGEVREDSQ